jgi:hypothetical protein
MQSAFKIILISFLVMSVFSTINGQAPTRIYIDTLPRMKENYNYPGHYSLASIINKKEVNKGDEFEVDTYFTGYGEIGLSKVFITISADIFDSSSTYLGDLGSDSRNGIFWGKNRYPIGIGIPTVINFTGGISPAKNKSIFYISQYIDFTKEPRSLVILTEGRLLNAPLVMQLKLKDKVNPGEYSISLYYTYFNGQEWCGEKTEIQFKVNSFFEEHFTAFQIAGIIIGIITIIPILYQLIGFYQRVFKKAKIKK